MSRTPRWELYYQLHMAKGTSLTKMWNTKKLMHCHCGTNKRAPWWTFTDPCKPEVRPGAREESASPAWLAAPAMNALDKTKVFIWRPDTGRGLTLYRKCHSHNTQGKRHNTLESNPSREYYQLHTAKEQVWQKCEIQKNWCTVTVSPTKEHHGGYSRTPAYIIWLNKYSVVFYFLNF